MIFNAIFDVLIVGVLINSKVIFDVLISKFWSTKKTISTIWSSTEFSEFFLVFDVVIFVVLTFSPIFHLHGQWYLIFLSSYKNYNQLCFMLFCKPWRYCLNLKIHYCPISCRQLKLSIKLIPIIFKLNNLSSSHLRLI